MLKTNMERVLFAMAQEIKNKNSMDFCVRMANNQSDLNGKRNFANESLTYHKRRNIWRNTRIYFAAKIGIDARRIIEKI